MQAAKLKSAVVLYLAGMVMIHVAVVWSVREQIRKGYSDFSIYYCAGTIVRKGMGHQLYDSVTQFKVQREFSPEVAIRLDALPYNHPPFEAVLFAPFTYVSYPAAFALWDLANMAMLFALPFLLRPHLPQLQNYPWPVWLLTSLAFFPIFFALLQGQDAILLLLLYTLAFISLKSGRDVLAGGWLALGLFKPHFILPLLFLLLVQGRKKVLYGFLPVAAILTFVSISIVGWEGILSYPRYVLHLEDTMARGAIMPSDMPNLRGILYLLLGGDSHAGAVALVLSVVVLLYAAWRCRAGTNLFDLKFSLGAVATVLVSYHGLGYDLSMLLLSIFLLANELLGKPTVHGWPDLLTITAIAVLFFSPLQLLLLMRGNRLGLEGWAFCCCCAASAGKISLRSRAGATSVSGRVKSIATGVLVILVTALTLNRNFYNLTAADTFFSITLACTAIVFLHVRPLWEESQLGIATAVLVLLQVVALKVPLRITAVLALVGISSLALLAFRRIWSNEGEREQMHYAFLPPLIVYSPGVCRLRATCDYEPVAPQDPRPVSFQLRRQPGSAT